MDFRQSVIKAFGEFPQKPELRYNEISSTVMDGYTLQSVEYYVEDNEKVNAYLMLPETLKEKNPAILAAHQHAMNFHIGKSEVVGLAGDPMFAYGLELCKRGYVVIAPDHLCFEERIKPHFRSRPENDRQYELYEFVTRMQNGSSLKVKYLHDMIIAVDVLENLPFVDKNKIGVIGHSLGGQEATWLTWYDKRIAAGVSSCGFSQMGVLFDKNIILALSMYIPGFTKIGDMCDIVHGIAPRPFFMTSGAIDWTFPIEGVEYIIENAVSRYEQLGSPDNFRSIIFDGGHRFESDVRQEVYDWLDRVLAKKA